eukprot:5702924-Alexandrium_andersonii.AAC.1
MPPDMEANARSELPKALPAGHDLLWRLAPSPGGSARPKREIKLSLMLVRHMRTNPTPAHRTQRLIDFGGPWPEISSARIMAE